MDKYEYRMRLEQIKEFYHQEKYKEAAKIANTIDWKKVRDWSTLAMIINIYDEVGQVEDAKNVCIIAYNRKLGGKRLVYKLAELMIRTGELEDATELYDEFVEMAPKDLNRYSLLYKLNIAKGASVDKLIAVLNEYKQHDRDEGVLYELACLYEKAGMIEKAMNECDEIILWFNGGDYYEDALKLKRKYGALTHNQKLMLERLDSLKEKPVQAKKQTVTIELPKGILKAEDIVKAVTGKLDTTAIEKAAKETGDAAKALVVATGATVNATSGELISKTETEAEAEVSIPASKETPIESGDFEKRVLNNKGAKADTGSVKFSPEMLAKLEEARAAVKPKEVVREESLVHATGVIDIEESIVGEVQNIVEEEPEAAPLEEEALVAPEMAEEDRYIGQKPLEPGETLPEFNNTVKIPIPDYSVYDTVNIQKEIAENIKPYIDAMQSEDSPFTVSDESEATEEAVSVEDDEVPVITDRPPIKIGDIVNNEEGTFRVIADTNRIIMPNDVGYKLDPLNTVEIEALKVSEDADEAPVDEADKIDALLEEEVVPEEEAVPAEESEDAETLEASDEVSAISSALDSMLEDKPSLGDTKEFDISALKEIAASLDEAPQSDDSEESEAVSQEEATDDSVEQESVEPKKQDLSATMDIMAAIEKSLSKVESFDGGTTSTDVFLNADDEEEDEEDEEEPEEENYNRVYDKLFKECFHRYASLKGMKKQIYDALEIIRNKEVDGTSVKGNIIITGNKSVNKLDLGIAFVKALNMLYPENKRKIAKTNADSLNKRGIRPALEKLMGSALIIEDASNLSDACANELYEIMSENTDDMLVILTGTESGMIKFVSDKIKLSSYFDSIIEIRKYSVNELVDIAKEYASNKNCSISDKVLLKLYLVIDKLNTGEDSADVAMAEKVIDVAIENAKDRISGSFLGKLKKSKDGAIALKESDITTELEREEREEVEEDNEDE